MVESIPEVIGSNLGVIIGISVAIFFAISVGYIPGILNPIWNFETNETLSPEVAGISIASLVVFVLLVSVVIAVYYSVKGE